MPLQILPRGETDLEAFSNAASGLLKTIMQVKQLRRDRDVKAGLMNLIAAGGKPEQMAGYLGGQQTQVGGQSFQTPQSGGGILQRILSTFNPMTPAAVGSSSLEDAIMGRLIQGRLDPMMGLRKRYMESQIGATEALTAERKRPKELKPPKMITVFDEEKDKSYYHAFNTKTGEYRNTGKVATKPKGNWGTPILAGVEDPYGIAEGMWYQVSPEGEVKQLTKHEKPAKPTKDEVQYWLDRGYTPKEAQMNARFTAEISAGLRPRASTQKHYDNMGDVEKMKFLTTLKGQAEGHYFGVEGGLKEPRDPKVAGWADKELQKLPMFETGTETTQKPSLTKNMTPPAGQAPFAESVRAQSAPMTEFDDVWPQMTLEQKEGVWTLNDYWEELPDNEKQEIIQAITNDPENITEILRRLGG